MPIYLDYNATAPLKPSARGAMQRWLELPANPSSAHSFGREAKKHLEDARKIIAEYISAWPNELVFTASGTEANATALAAFPARRRFVSAVEHVSVLKQSHAENGDIIPVDAQGVVQLAVLDRMLAMGHPALVSIMLANNETGVIQPISEVAELCKKYGALLHVDAVQALGKIPVDFSLLGADMVTLSGHKSGGPVGAAVLVVKNNIALQPLLTGGGQELGRRAGTENIAAIAGFAASIHDVTPMETLRDGLAEMEATMEAHGGIIMGKHAPRLPNTLCVVMPMVGNEVQLMDCDIHGFAVSAGSACSSGRIEVSHVLLAMGVPQEMAACAIRISGGWATTRDELQKFTKCWLALAQRLKK